MRAKSYGSGAWTLPPTKGREAHSRWLGLPRMEAKPMESFESMRRRSTIRSTPIDGSITTPTTATGTRRHISTCGPSPFPTPPSTSS